MSSSDTKFFGIKANNPLSNLESLLVAGLPALFKEQEQKRKEKQIKERSQGWVSNPSILTLDGGTWDETFINSTPYDGGNW